MKDVFVDFSQAVAAQFNRMVNMQGATFVRANVTGDELWDTYLESIPAEENQIFRERRYYDANYDKNFIRRVGNLVAIKDGEIHTIWDVQVGSFFNAVSKKLADTVRNASILTYYLTTEKVAGSLPNIDNINPEITWNHFYAQIPNHLLNDNCATIIGKARENYSLLKRSITELTDESVETVQDLIAENALYRGEDHKQSIQFLVQLKNEFNKVEPEKQELWFWETADKHGNACRIINSVIGTLLKDISQGVDLEDAVKMFESKVAPHNYKRSSAVVTPSMVNSAKAKLKELGYTDSINRRLAKPEDIPFDAMEFASNNTETKALDVFDDISLSAKKTVKNLNLNSIRVVSYQEFKDMLTPDSKIELLKNGSLAQHQMVLTAPKDDSSKNFFKWNNPIGWSYLNSDTTDAIKERVKQAGGNVEGELRVSLAWFNTDDLDLSCVNCSNRNQIIYFGNKQAFGGHLDVDMNVSATNASTTPVENIYWETLKHLPYGKYAIQVNQFNLRNRDSDTVGFKLQVEIQGVIHNFSYPNLVRMQYEPVIEIEHNSSGVEITYVNPALIKESVTSATGEFIPVKSIIKSPQQWDNDNGMKQHFFITEDFEIDKPVRGFFNEFLDPALTEHRKVFEIVGSRTKIEPESNSVRGYGFSESSGNSVIVSVTGSKGSQLVKVVF